MARIRSIKPETWRQAGVQSTAFTLYCIAEQGCESSGPCKVGIAAHMQKRMSALQGGNWRYLVLCWQIQIATRSDALDVERHCLTRFRPSIYTASAGTRLQSEWVNAVPLKVLEVAVSYLNSAIVVEKVA